MKFKSLFAVAAIAALAFVGCDPAEELGEARISVDPASLSLGTGDDSKTVTLVATRDWHIDSQPDWVALDKTSGTASTKEQTITVSVDANKGNDREGEVVFTIGLAKASLAIKQAGEAGELKVGSGTLEDPYSVAGVIKYLQDLGADVTSPDVVYVKGKVSTIATDNSGVEQYYSNTGTYGNATFYISDDGTATDQFECYRVLYLGNQKFASGDTDIVVGDEVIICGKVVNYKGNTPETSQGTAYLYSLNGVTGDNTQPDPGAGNAKGTGTQADPYNPAAAAAAVANLTWTSSTEYQKTDPVYVKGKIKNIAVSNDVEQFYANTGDYGNASFYITDADDETGEFYVFRALYLGNVAYAVGQTDIKVGDVVVIYGALMNYKGNTPETVANEAYLYSLNGATSSEAGPVFGVEKTEITVGASATSATINVTGNVAWTAASSDATIDPASGEGKGAITVSFAANTDTENAKTYTVVVSTTEDVATKSYTVTITQSKASAGGEVTVSVDLTAQGYSNQQEVSSITVDGVTVAFDKGSNSNAPKFYTTGNAVRVYGGGFLTVSADGKNVTKVEFTFGSGDGTNELSADSGALNNGVWEGDASSVKFTVDGTSGHRRFAKLVVTAK